MTLAAFATIAQQLYVHWRINNTVMNLQGHANVDFNIVTQLANDISQKIEIDFLANNELGLPTDHLFISQKSVKDSLSDLPNNTKSWQSALYLDPERRVLTPIKMRLRSGNPTNWIFKKKSWRIKFKKSDLKELTRVFNYVVIQDPSFINGYLNHIIFSKLLGLNQHAELVELFINNVSSGIYLRTEHLDESFLRKNNIMPVNIYKGEFFNEDRIYGFDSNLFNNPEMWNKTSIFNQLDPNDFSDLNRFFTLIKLAENDDEAYSDLKDLAPFDHWARVSIAQELTQNWHNDDSHNMRLVSDPWKGHVTMLPHDTEGTDLTASSVLYDKASQPLLRHYLNDSEFLLYKQHLLNRLLQNEEILSIIKKVEKKLPLVKVSANRDPNRFRMRNPFLELDPKSNFDLTKIHELNISRLKNVHSFFNQKLISTPELDWAEKDKILSVTLNGYPPITSIKILGSQFNGTIYFDKDGDHRISSADIEIPVVSGVIQATLFANRDLKGDSLPTTFNFILLEQVEINGINAINPFSRKKVTAEASKQLGFSPMEKNLPLVKLPPAKKVILEGDINIDKTKVFTEPVIISAGANITLSGGASLVFKNKLEINGTNSKPVTITGRNKASQNEYQPWGVLAVSGPNSSGTTISNLKLTGGSGDVVSGIRYIGMLSIHNTSNIKIIDSSINQNFKFDDMVHVIYSDDVIFSRTQLKNAQSDGIDIDMSTAKLIDSTIMDSGNDAIDLMASAVFIKNSSLIRSGDKGASIGEGAIAVLEQNVFEENKIGVEVKDKSQALIVNNNFLHNDIHINAYKKNWRYGGGGKTTSINNEFSGSNNTIKSDKHSTIHIYGNGKSNFQTFGRQKNIFFHDNLCEQKDCVYQLLKDELISFSDDVFSNFLQSTETEY